MNVRLIVTKEERKPFYNGQSYYMADVTSFFDYLFITVESENGKKFYVNGVETNREEGNKLYKETLKNATKVKKVVIHNAKEAQKMAEQYMKGYDYYTMYIDNAQQEREAEEHNERICKCVGSLKKVYNFA